MLNCNNNQAGGWFQSERFSLPLYASYAFDYQPYRACQRCSAGAHTCGCSAAPLPQSSGSEATATLFVRRHSKVDLLLIEIVVSLWGTLHD
jgi:hypothetical protein